MQEGENMLVPINTVKALIDQLRSIKVNITYEEVVEDYDVDVRNIRNGVVDITNNVVVKCCK